MEKEISNFKRDLYKSNQEKRKLQDELAMLKPKFNEASYQLTEEQEKFKDLSFEMTSLKKQLHEMEQDTEKKIVSLSEEKFNLQRMSTIKDKTGKKDLEKLTQKVKVLTQLSDRLKKEKTKKKALLETAEKRIDEQNSLI